MVLIVHTDERLKPIIEVTYDAIKFQKELLILAIVVQQMEILSRDFQAR